ncbi:MAG: flagellar assembly protein FliW [Gemmatimonadetes bacterium]|nr:flagellar assembly protein FliW [Gemmatimonadota bacterium]
MTQETVIPKHPLAAGRSVPVGELWQFPEGLIGVGLSRAALLPIADAAPFELLCDADGSDFGLIVVDPQALVADYVLALTPEELAPLGAVEPDALQIRVPVVLPGESSALTLNLKGPVLLAPQTRTGVQRVSLDEGHSLRYAPDLTGTGTSSCSS